MSSFTNLSAHEVERRRLLSVEAMTERGRVAFEQWYQQRLDMYYWKHGNCCAGCDHWSSFGADSGECYGGPPVSGEQVLQSMGIHFFSYIPAPGQPYTSHEHVCGAFKDDFDWSSLEPEYLEKIGANPR